jgi:hypothetical protein
MQTGPDERLRRGPQHPRVASLHVGLSAGLDTPRTDAVKLIVMTHIAQNRTAPDFDSGNAVAGLPA